MKHIAIFVGCLILAGCGSNKGNQTNPLSAEQKAVFADTLHAIGRVQFADPKTQQAVASDPRDESLEKMKELLNAGNCEYTKPAEPNPGGDPFNKTTEAGLKVFGATCPITLELSAKLKTEMTQTSYSNHLDFILKYEAKHEEFAKLNDVTFVDLKGQGGRNQTATSVSGNLDFEGAVKSRQHGDLKMYITGKLEGTIAATANSQLKQKSEMVFGVQYPKFTAELKQTLVTDQGVTKEYFLNGQKITAEEFRALLNKAGALGQVSIDNGTGKK